MIRPVAVSESIERFFARTPTLPPATHTESYALGSRDVLLVEPATPYDEERRDWLAWARGLAGRGRSVLAIVATHHHPDHVGGAEFLARELGVPLWAHPRARSFGVTVDRDLVDGDRLTLAGPAPEEWTVLHTPGHASDHVCLFEPTTRTLVVGDMVASVGTILVAPGDGDMAEYLRQLERLLKLDAKLALPAHGDPILDPPKLLRAYLVHRAMREAWIERSVVQHPDSTLEALVKIAYADTPVEVHPIAQLSLAAHLEKLVAEGRVSMIDGRFRSTEG